MEKACTAVRGYLKSIVKASLLICRPEAMLSAHINSCIGPMYAARMLQMLTMTRSPSEATLLQFPQDTHLAKLKHHAVQVILSHQLEVLDRGTGHPAIEIEAVCPQPLIPSGRAVHQSHHACGSTLALHPGSVPAATPLSICAKQACFILLLSTQCCLLQLCTF